MTYRILVLVSGTGSNLQALIDQASRYGYEIAAVISNKSDAYALKRAQAANIPTYAPTRGDGRPLPIARFEEETLNILEQTSVDLVVLAGFMRILSARFVGALGVRAINLHPSILPAYKGLDTHARVLQAGDKYHGASVHWVTPELDSGAVLVQGIMSVSHTCPDALQADIHKIEHQILPWTVGLLRANLAVNTPIVRYFDNV